MRFKIVWGIGLGTLTIATLIFYLSGGELVSAQEQVKIMPAANLSAHPPIDLPAQVTPFDFDESCRQCHADTDAVFEFPSGETLSARVDLIQIDTSAHGSIADPLSCTSCHDGNAFGQPHDPIEAVSLREYELLRGETCTSCHVDNHVTSHEDLPPAQAVTCTDCHGSHDVQTVASWNSEAQVDSCVACHDPGERERLSAVIEGGLFTRQADQNYCLACHSQAGPQLFFENGDQRSVLVDPAAFNSSVHGEGNDWGTITCRNCHEMDPYPHEPLEVSTGRDYTLQQNLVCSDCHEQIHEAANDPESVHGRALAEGQKESAVCTDCHGSHDTPLPHEPRSRLSTTCQQCHSTIYEEYSTSIHGEALLTENNLDVPTCVDCHGVHQIDDPTTNLFRLRSPQLCSTCHANEELMTEYNISTDVFNTYVADFHGTTATLFDHEDPNVEINTALCYDCHGVHDIKDPEDPQAGIKANLLTTCQECHPNATENFPDAWTSHFEPSLDNYPLVFLVNLFYQIVIPVTVVFLGFLVSTDVYRRVRERFATREE